MSTQKKGWVIGITGASGSIYGVRLCQYLLDQGIPIHLLITEAGWQVLRQELDWQTSKRDACLEQHFGGRKGTYSYHPIGHIGASIASGSFQTEGMVIIPCSMGTLSGIAHGSSDNLLERAADVMLKERRPLLLVPRETPMHAVHLQNMLTLSNLGASIIPAMPAFYHKPKNMDELIDFLVGKVLDMMRIEHDIYRRWGEAHEINEQKASNRAD